MVIWPAREQSQRACCLCSLLRQLSTFVVLETIALVGGEFLVLLGEHLEHLLPDDSVAGEAAVSGGRKQEAAQRTWPPVLSSKGTSLRRKAAMSDGEEDDRPASRPVGQKHRVGRSGR